jgi:hypothetical protein
LHLGKIMVRIWAGGPEPQEQVFDLGIKRISLEALSFHALCWMQWRKLTIKICLFLSIQQNLSLSPCVSCNVAKNTI